jgi:predicted neuraminidase
MKKITIALAIMVMGSFNFLSAQSERWKSGILVDEFIFEKAPFPESHAASIAQTPKGLIAAWFGGTKERNPDVCIWVSRRMNDQWTEPVNVANGIINDTLRYACWNPVLFQVPGGELLLFYKTGPRVSAWKGWMKTSKDGGLTWSDAQALPEGFIGPVKNKPVMLKDGKIIAPSSTEGDGWKLHFEVSDDKGKTWTKVGPINDGKTLNAIQPSILFHKGGKLQVLARSKNRAVLETWSYDNGKTWTPIAKSNLPNNNSGTDAVTLKDGRQLLVYNHVLPHDSLKNGKGARTPLNVSVSKDGKKWYAALVLEDSPISQYSYPSVIQGADGMVHIVYTWRRQKIKYVKVDPSKLKLTEIKNGVWPGETVKLVQVKAEEE